MKTRALFLDIGGVLLTNGWDRALRKKIADFFQIDYAEMDSRHQFIFDTFEIGKMSFDEYLGHVIFYLPRSFSLEEIKQYIFNVAHAYDEMIALIKEIKHQYGLKVGVVSNEGKELAIDRIHRFGLDSFIDFFIISSFVHLRKPDCDIYRLALDIAQVSASQVVYIEDRQLLVTVAQGLGISSIHHTEFPSTVLALKKFL
jgi:putative hydrolase of the HAD superfamily